MTVSTTSSKAQYNGNGATTAFSVPFPYTAKSAVEVISTSAAGVDTTQTLDTHYTLTAPGASGTVTFLTAPASGARVTIRSIEPNTQAVDLTAGGAESSAVREGVYDKLTILVQQLAEKVGRALKLKATSLTGEITLPEPEAGGLLAWNSGGTDLENKQAATLGAALFPASSTDNAVARFDGPGGKTLQNSPVIVGDSGNVSGVAAISMGGALSGATVVATGATAARGLEARAADVINVLDFGADPTGATDSTAAFQAAATAYAAGNREFWCPDGFYKIASQIVFGIPAAVISRNEPPPALRFGTNAHIQATATISGGMIVWGGLDYDGIIENGAMSGGLFDCNDFADVGFDVPFCNNVLIFGAQARNHKLYGFRAGRTASVARSYGAIFDQCQTERYGFQIAITGITKANPGVVTLSSAPSKAIVTGDKITLSPVNGMTQLNNRTFTVTAITPTTFSIGENTTSYGTFTDGIAYSGYAPTGSCGIYFENCGDSHAINCTPTGNQIGISSSDGIYDGKFTNNHVWNFLFNGELLYGYDMAGDNQLVGCQCDGPFQYAYRFTGLRNNLVACQVTYEGLTYGGVDNYAYPIRVETGGGATAVACSWKAQDPGARLAGEFSGDAANYLSYNNLTLNSATSQFGEFHRRDINGNLEFTRQNRNAGSSATVVNTLTTDASSLYTIAASTAGGAYAALDWQGSGALNINGNGGLSLQTGNSTHVNLTTAGRLLGVKPGGGIGYGAGAGGTVTQATSKSTGVTLDKVCGRITMNNAALAAGAEVGFTVTNSAVAEDDVVIVNISGGASFNSYQVGIDDVSNGSFRVSLTNVSAGSLSEAVVLNYAVIKAVTS